MCKVYDERNYRIIRALNNFAVENDYRLFVYHTCSDLYWKTLSEKGEQSVFDLIDYNITDAVVTFEEGVYAENIMTKIRMDAAEYGKPVISVGVEHDDCISIKFDYAKGFEQVVRHVIEQHGVRDIGFIAGRKDEENSEERIAVFRKLLEEYDIPFRNDVFYYGDYWSAPTLKAVDDMIEGNKVPRAIVCANDMMAIAAGAEFQRRGYKIPEDIIITGFDGLEEARYCTPMLTTSGCSYDDTAKTIINTISKALAGEKTEKVYTVDYDLSVENSCGCEPSVEQINTGEHIRILRDRMNRYQDEERVLYELAVNIMNCETPKTLAALLKEYAFGDMAVVVNGDFFDERKDPRVSNREPLFMLHGSSSVPQEYVHIINTHGGALKDAIGIPEEQLRRAAKSAVCKINIDSDSRLAMTAAVRLVLTDKPAEFDPRKYLGPAREEMKKLYMHKCEKVLGSAGKA